MISVAMRMAYNGGAFYGFQSQKEVQSVSQLLKEKLKSVGINSDFIASGRTDKGVHASAQVISLKIPDYWDNLESLQQRLNAKLQPFVKIKRIWRTNSSFNARFSAKRRGYCYILNKQNSPFLNAFSLPYKIQNKELLRLALMEFVGTYDFSAFMKNDGSGKNGSIRSIFRADLRESRDFYLISFWGSGFLRAQIRLMVGFLLEMDRGNLSLNDLKAQLNGTRIYTTPIAPNGLFLTRVDY